MALRGKMVGRAALLRKIRDVVPSVEDEYAGAIELGARELADAIHARAPRDAGDYAASIEAARLSGRPEAGQLVGMRQTKDPNAWGIFADWMWRFLEFGTKAHIIRPRKPGGRLRFSVNGEGVSAAQVMHPGSAPRPHIFPTYRQYRKRIRSRVARSITKALRKLARR